MQKNRFWEIDFYRGMAIILMIIYHFIFDLNYFNFIKVDMYSGLLGILQKFIAISFILLVGISLNLSSKLKTKFQILKKGLYVFSAGLILTLLSYIFVRNSAIYFGILHFIGISIIISTLLIKYFKFNLILGILILISSKFISSLNISFPWLLPLGIKFHNFQSLDYFPLIPWYSFVLFGIFLGKLLYTEKRNFNFIDEPNSFIVKLLKYFGKKSLLVYLIHQPILILILYLIKEFF